MTLVSLVRDLYSLDTLDTRFTTSARTPSKSASADSAKGAVTKDGTKGDTLPPGTSPSRWGTLEFYFYALVFIVTVPQMYKAVWDVSQPSHPYYPNYEKLLSPGWLFGRKVDNSDNQYSGFRDNIPYLAILVVLHPLARHGIDYIRGSTSAPTANGAVKQGHTKSNPDIRLRQRISFDCIFGIIFIVALHGFSALKILSILYINFSITTLLPENAIPAATWVFNIGVLVANELAQGYRFAQMAEIISPSYAPAAEWGKILDSFGGLMPRWEIFFKVTVLRLISFNIDCYWSLDRERAGSPIEKQLDPANLSERDRVKIPAPAARFTSFRTYLAYALYSPLYLAGPIVTFNDYVSQCTYAPPSITRKRNTLYVVRFLLALFCMEFLLHTIYVVAISKSSPDYRLVFTPFQLAMLAYFNLAIIWLKLLIPWRFFRLWSLVDGIDPPENMLRCMSDNYSTVAFWRSWHRSFNRWIVRYVYVPLGGSGHSTSRVRSIFNMLLVFTFVALWHDLNPRLLAWGWLVVLFVLPEVLASLAFPASRWKTRPNTYRMICGIGAVFNILLMMAANLVGFALGLDGLKGLIHGIVATWSGIVFMGAACAALFVGAQVMFEHREGEIRKGIRLKC